MPEMREACSFSSRNEESSLTAIAARELPL